MLRRLYIIIIVLLCPFFVEAQNYSSLWKEVERAGEKDLPKTQMQLLDKIAVKAQKERAYGHMLKAQMMRSRLQVEIAPDSLQAELQRLRALETDEVSAVIYEAVLSRVDDKPFELKGREELLASKKAETYFPFVEKGIDSGLFNGDLLHVVGMYTENYEAMYQYYLKQGNRRAAMMSAVLAKHDPDSLIAEYGDLLECGEVAIAKYEAFDYKTTEKQKIEWIDEALGRWGKWKRMDYLRNERKMLTQPGYNTLIGSDMIRPGETIKVYVKDVRNLPSVTLTVRNAKTRKVVKTETLYFSGKKDYELSEDSITVGPLPLGEYVVDTAPRLSAHNSKLSTLNFSVTDLMVLCESLPGNKTRYAVVSATTGQPIAGARLRLEFRNAGKTTELTMDGKGEAVYSYGNQAPNKVYAYTDTDRAYVSGSMWGYYNFHELRNDRNVVKIYTDRSIYRPSQTVHASVLAYNAKRDETVSVVEGKTMTLRLRNANGKVVAEKQVTTDSYGTAACDFSLPQSGLTGRYSLQTDFGNGYVGIQVEEYKRPTFEVTFDEVKEKYAAGDTVTLRGHARSFAGVPVQGAKVNYSLKRLHSFWWWFRGNDEVIGSGEIQTDDNGEFVICMPLTMPEANGERPSRFFRFTADADVTDQGGETQSGTISLPLGTKPAVLSSDLPAMALRDSMKTATFSLLNAAGEKVEGKVLVTIDGNAPIEVDANTPYFINPENITRTPEPPYLRTLGTLGKHIVEATAMGDTLRHEIIVFSLEDKTPVVETHDWFYASADEFSDKPVVVQVGASDKDTHIFYGFFAGEKIIESGTVDVSNRLFVREFTYKEEYGDGLLLTYAWVKEGKCYTHSAKISKPQPDKRLVVKWTTFRDRLKAGQKEEWTLRITRPDGTPAKATLLSTLYDSSLDQLMPNKWGLDLGFGRYLPNTQWRYTSKIGHSYSDYEDLLLKDVSSLTYSHFAEDALIRPWYGHRIMVRGGRALGSVDAMPMMMKATAVAANDVAGIEEVAMAESAMVYDTADEGTSETHSAKKTEVRENFAETAFFYPSLLTDSKGNVSIKFTLPESVTTWRFLGMAHDKDMNYAFTDTTAVAKKDLMVQPNMPRFVRKGDKATISAKIINTAEKNLSGKVTMTLLDAETEEVVATEQLAFSVDKDKTTSVTFGINPEDISRTPVLSYPRTPVLICRVVAEADGFSDGEQHYLPVLSDEEMVISTQTFTFTEPGKKIISRTPVSPYPRTPDSITLELTNNPAWLVVQALPYMAQANERNAISLAASYYVNSLGRYLVSQSPDIEKVFERWKQEQGNETSLMSQLEKNQELKTLVLEETPWVASAEREADRKQALANFFDENTLNNRLETALEGLRKLQNSDGSFSWWEGMEGSPVMTAQVVEFLTRLNLLAGKESATEQILSKAHKYLGNVVVEEVEKIREAEAKKQPYYISSYYALQWVYVCAVSDRKLSAREKSAADYLIAYLEKQKLTQSMYAKALMAVVWQKNGQQQKAREYAQSLKEYTVYREDMGRYYDTPRASYSWCSYNIPTQVAAIEAIKMVSPADKTTVEEMQRWLLQQKRTQTWDTPINSVNAVYAVLDGNTSLLASQPMMKVAVDGKNVSLPKETAGTGYVKTRLPEGNKVTIEKTSLGTSWGTVYTQSVQPLKDIDEASTGISVKREIISTEPITVGSRVKVRITITADRNYDYVQVVDKRAACLEPVGQISGYRWGYYIAPKDQTTNYYFSMLAKGIHTIETEYYVDRAGEYQTGTCTVQCAYAPEFVGRTKSEVVKVKR